MTPVLQGLVPLSKLGKLFDPRSGINVFSPTTSQLHQISMSDVPRQL